VPPTLLLADDSVTIQRVIELTFADEDVRVIAVSNGEEAIALLNGTPPDIVLADVGMPGPSGYDIAQHIKDTPRLAHIPVVLLTGAFEPIDQAKAAAVGCDGVLAKPFEPQLVIGRVKELLAKPKRPAAAPAAPPPPAAPEPAASWGLPSAAPAGAGELTKPQPPAAVSDYFDRLDQAFANLPGPETMKAPSLAMGADIDWFGSTRSPVVEAPPDADTWDRPSPKDMPDLPLSQASPAPVLGSAGEAGGSPDAAAAMPVSQPVSAVLAAEVTPPKARAMPPLADAFAALLAAEQSGPAPSGAPEWPAGPTPGPLTPDLVEQVTRSVLEQLSDRVVRETVRDIVTEVVERLVREEIERIKSSIK
jgi:CheY-like chemotaxis protein